MAIRSEFSPLLLTREYIHSLPVRVVYGAAGTASLLGGVFMVSHSIFDSCSPIGLIADIVGTVSCFGVTYLTGNEFFKSREVQPIVDTSHEEMEVQSHLTDSHFKKLQTILSRVANILSPTEESDMQVLNLEKVTVDNLIESLDEQTHKVEEKIISDDEALLQHLHQLSQKLDSILLNFDKSEVEAQSVDDLMTIDAVLKTLDQQIQKLQQKLLDLDTQLGAADLAQQVTQKLLNIKSRINSGRSSPHLKVYLSRPGSPKPETVNFPTTYSPNPRKKTKKEDQ
jgi:hypothetical protein